MPLRILLLASSVVACLLGGSPSRAADVLLLGDTEADGQVGQALEAAGHAVTYAGPYFAWDGDDPDIQDHQVAVLLSGEEYFADLQPAAVAAIEQFLADGCGLVTTEWSAYAVAQEFRSAQFGELLPVRSPNSEYGEGSSWNVLAPGHPLVAGVPASFTDAGGWSLVDAVPGTFVVVADPAQGGNPMLSYSSAHGGTSVHVNHDLTDALEAVPENVRVAGAHRKSRSPDPPQPYRSSSSSPVPLNFTFVSAASSTSGRTTRNPRNSASV